MKAIPSYPLLKQRCVSLTQTPHGTDTAACHGRRPRRPSGQGTHPGTVARVLRSGCYTTGSLTLAAKPSGDHADNRLAYPNSLQEGSVAASQQRTRLVRVMKHLLEAIG